MSEKKRGITYHSVRQFIYDFIRDDNKKGISSFLFDLFIIILIVTNVLLVILDTFSIPHTVRVVFYNIELFSVIVFTLEYLLRLWTANFIHPDASPTKARLKYSTSPIAIIDLLAILPFYLPFIIPMDLRVLRVIRLLRLLRLLKINHYTSALSMVGSVIKRKSAQLLSSMVVVLFLMIIASVLMYNIEHDAQPDVFTNAFSGFWWAVATLTTVGYGDIYPVTIIGKSLGTVIALLGIGLVAVPTGIISSGFIEDISYRKEMAKDKQSYCPHCGKKLI